MLQVKKGTLLMVAGVVWLAAGINILRIGIEALAVNLAKAGLTSLLLVLAVVVLAAFLAMFRKIVPRRQPWMPLEFFAAFYTGLGSALSVSGIRFIKAWWDHRKL